MSGDFYLPPKKHKKSESVFSMTRKSPERGDITSMSSSGFNCNAKLREVRRTLLGGSPLACRARMALKAQQAAAAAPAPATLVLNEASRPDFHDQSHDMFSFDHVQQHNATNVNFDDDQILQ